MEGQMRRDTIIKMLGEKGKPLSGTELAKELGVSLPGFPGTYGFLPQQKASVHYELWLFLLTELNFLPADLLYW